MHTLLSHFITLTEFYSFHKSLLFLSIQYMKLTTGEEVILNGGSVPDTLAHRQSAHKPALCHFQATSGSAVMSMCMVTCQSGTHKMAAACTTIKFHLFVTGGLPRKPSLVTSHFQKRTFSKNEWIICREDKR